MKIISQNLYKKNYKIKEIWGANSNADWNNIDATAIPLSWAEMAGEVEVDSTIGGEANGQKVQGDFVTLLNTPSNANEGFSYFRYSYQKRKTTRT